MSKYEILENLPWYADFSEWPKKEVRAFGKWFMENRYHRIDVLRDHVRRDPDFANWEADYSPESLKPLSHWFEKNITTEPMPEEEIIKWTEILKDKGSAATWRISKESETLIFDTSIYFGEIILRQFGLEWEQYINTTRNNIEYGLMIIHKDNHINSPWKAMRVSGLKVATKSFPYEGLYDLYNIFTTIFSGNYRPFL